VVAGPQDSNRPPELGAMAEEQYPVETYPPHVIVSLSVQARLGGERPLSESSHFFLPNPRFQRPFPSAPSPADLDHGPQSEDGPDHAFVVTPLLTFPLYGDTKKQAEGK
jgi:hypothetical protein